MTETFPIPGIVSLILGLQFATFGWRINREISVGDKGLPTWLPVTDIVNLASMMLTLVLCILLPLLLGRFTKLSEGMLGLASVLICAHPINMASHYELLGGGGRLKYFKTTTEGPVLDVDAVPYFPRQERIAITTTVCVAFVVGIAIFLQRLCG